MAVIATIKSCDNGSPPSDAEDDQALGRFRHPSARRLSHCNIIFIIWLQLDLFDLS
jgi:hypothetical protein